MRLFKLPLTLAAVVALLAIGGTGTATAKSCSDFQVSNGYIVNLKANGTSCSRAKEVAKGHYSKRRARGGWDGKFNGSIKGYSCTESDRRKSSTELNARVSCKKGGARISFAYQSNR